MNPPGLSKPARPMRHSKASASPAVVVRGPSGFSLIELVVVILIIGILASLTVPRYASHLARTNDQMLLIELATVRNAIERYSVANDRALPAASTGNELVSILTPWLPDGFPEVSVGPTVQGGNPASVEIESKSGSITADVTPLNGWKYNPQTGQFIINWDAETKLEPGVRYDEW